MLSLDNFVQAAGSTQGFNRYSYGLNNPLKYVDPDGELYILDSWLLGFANGFIRNDNPANNRFQNGLEKANQMASNDAKLWRGLFSTDENKSILGRGIELYSRFNHQILQTTLGFLIMQGALFTGQVNNVESRWGVTALDTEFRGGAFTAGNFILGPTGFRPDWQDHLFAHEYGHYIQSQMYGVLYLPIVAIPSVVDFYAVDEAFNLNLHDRRWYEAEASQLGGNYFSTVTNGQFDRVSFITGRRSVYINPRRSRNASRDVFNNEPFNVNSEFHWTDVVIGSSVAGIINNFFTILKHF